MNKLIFYPNCSNGGVTAVIRSRASAEPDTNFLAVFCNDRGGRHAFDDLPNVKVRIIQSARLKSYLVYLRDNFEFDSISVLSSPEAYNILVDSDKTLVTYEFHSSDMKIVENELKDLEKLDWVVEVVVPSEAMKSQISSKLPKRIAPRLVVVPNKVDTNVFQDEGCSNFLDFLEPDKKPLIWVGRLEASKGAPHFLRVLAKLPENYVGIAVVSLEKDVNRFERFLSECDALGVRNQVAIFMDLTQPQVANLYRSVKLRDGWYVSTSLNESFGYAVSEALSCGLRSVVFDLPVWDRFEGESSVKRVDMGDVDSVAKVILAGQ